jgi:hypothetical protein
MQTMLKLTYDSLRNCISNGIKQFKNMQMLEAENGELK